MADRTINDMMADWFQNGMTVRQIAEATGLTYSAVRKRIIRKGCDTSPPRKHPLDAYSCRCLGLHQGAATTTSRAVGDKIIAVAAKHECTIWEAVDRLLSE